MNRNRLTTVALSVLLTMTAALALAGPARCAPLRDGTYPTIIDLRDLRDYRDRPITAFIPIVVELKIEKGSVFLLAIGEMRTTLTEIAEQEGLLDAAKTKATGRIALRPRALTEPALATVRKELASAGASKAAASPLLRAAFTVGGPRKCFSSRTLTLGCYAAHLFPFDDESKSFTRMIERGVLARWLDENATESELWNYLFKTLYFGTKPYGVEVASANSFGKADAWSSLANAAYLAALEKNPSEYRRDPVKARARRDWILDQMLKEQLVPLTAAQVEAAKAEPVPDRKLK